MSSAERHVPRNARLTLIIIAAAFLLLLPVYPAAAEPAAGTAGSGAQSAGSTAPDDGTVQPEALRSGGGGYRSPSGSFSGGGYRSGVTPGGGGYSTGPRAPSSNVTRPPATTTPGAGAGYAPGRAGSFFGGLAAGALLSHLLNPFAGFGWGSGYGYGYGGGLGFVMSIVSLLIWGVLLYAAYRVIRRLFGGGGRGPGGGGWYR